MLYHYAIYIYFLFVHTLHIDISELMRYNIVFTFLEKTALVGLSNTELKCVLLKKNCC